VEKYKDDEEKGGRGEKISVEEEDVSLLG